MLNEILKNKVLQFLENAEIFYGKNLKINNSISTNGINFNRHFTTSNSKILPVEPVELELCCKAMSYIMK